MFRRVLKDIGWINHRDKWDFSEVMVDTGIVIALILIVGGLYYGQN